MKKTPSKFIDMKQPFSSGYSTGKQSIIIDSKPSVSFESTTSTKNVDVLLKEISTLDGELKGVKANVEYINGVLELAFESKRRLDVLEKWVESKESEKKRIDDYLNKTEKLHTATFSVILLAPIALLFVIYFAMSDIINTAPEWVNDALVAVLGLSAIANFINVAKFLPGDVKRIKEDISDLREKYRDVKDKLNEMN